MKCVLAIVVFAVMLSAPAAARNPADGLISGPGYVHLLNSLLGETENATPVVSPAVRIDLLALVLAYPMACADLQISSEKGVILVMQDGTRIVYDDGKEKTFEQKLIDPDLEDMLSQDYDPGLVTREIPIDFAPGRCRVDVFFRAVYGGDRSKVKAGLTSVDFLGSRVSFSKHNGAAQALERVAVELSRIVKQRPDLSDYILPLAGTFNYRHVKGTQRLSPHSYGIAIDLNPRKGAYWRWGKRPPNLLELRKQYPALIVSAFEKHGFVWGGKWYHYDLMHFEYRPELLLKTRLLKAFSGPLVNSDLLP